MKTARILFALLFALVVVPFVSGTAHAGSLQQLTGALDTLGDSRPSVSTTHTFTFTIGATASGFDLHYVKLSFCKEAFGDGTCTIPTGLGIDISGANGSLSTLTGTDLGTFTASHVGGSTDVLLTNTGSDVPTETGHTVSVKLSGVTNNSIGGCLNGNSSSGTCYVRIYLCTVGDSVANCAPDATNTSVAAQTIVSYTVVSEVTVSARVDPSFSFVVASVGDHTIMTNTGAGAAAVSTSVASTFDTLPFGHLSPNVPRYAAHKLTVTMNTTSGYTVTMKMRQQMTGVYTANNIDPFHASNVAWDAPQSWASPSVSNPANTDSGWIGANTTNQVITGWTSAVGKWGPVNGTENAVMKKNTSDNGLTPTYVTYAIEVSVNQPSDTYTGALVYNALPTY